MTDPGRLKIYNGTGWTYVTAGPSGYSGYSGWSGYSGISGHSGYSGYSGWSGISGYSGISGWSGWSGWSGALGPAGTSSINFVIDGNGLVPATGSKGYVVIPFSGTVSSWTILGNASGSCVVDIKKCTYSGFPTTASIAGTEKPTLSSAQKNQDTSLSSWTTSVTSGDVWEFNLDSATTVTRITVQISITRS